MKNQPKKTRKTVIFEPKNLQNRGSVAKHLLWLKRWNAGWRGGVFPNDYSYGGKLSV